MTPTQSRHLCYAFVLITSLALLWHGPIPQLADYHHFADTRSWLGIANAADVLSNLGFLFIGLFALLHPAYRQRAHPGYLLFAVSLIMTALGSAWYHQAPDNGRLLFDRLPIALACAGLLAGVWRDTAGKTQRDPTLPLVLFALGSVLWWRWTDLQGANDLRPYLLLQLSPLVLIPVLLMGNHRPRHEQAAFTIAIGAYIFAKLLELQDHAVYAQLGLMSGHTLKHLAATLAAGVIVASRLKTGRYSEESCPPCPQGK